MISPIPALNARPDARSRPRRPRSGRAPHGRARYRLPAVIVLSRSEAGASRTLSAANEWAAFFRTSLSWREIRFSRWLGLLTGGQTVTEAGIERAAGPRHGWTPHGGERGPDPLKNQVSAEL